MKNLDEFLISSCESASTEPTYLLSLSIVWITTCCGLILLPFINAPYGRFQANWVFSLPSWLGWILMEIPSLLCFLAITIQLYPWTIIPTHINIIDQLGQMFTPWIVGIPLRLRISTMLWALHYSLRSLVYPMLFKSPSKPMSIVPILFGLIFNIGNSTSNAIDAACPRYTTGFISHLLETILPKPSHVSLYSYLNSYYNVSKISHLTATMKGIMLTEVSLPTLFGSRVTLPLHYVIGITIFFIGLIINQHSDAILRNLRKPGESVYRIPEGGLFHYVSCANYLGEATEWLGYAIAIPGIASFSFFLATCSNLFPRALKYHRDYQSRFPAYPRQRKAVLPFIL